MTNSRRTRDRIYQRKRRLRRQLVAGKITRAEMELILAGYTTGQHRKETRMNHQTFDPTEAEPPGDGIPFDWPF